MLWHWPEWTAPNTIYWHYFWVQIFSLSSTRMSHRQLKLNASKPEETRIYPNTDTWSYYSLHSLYSSLLLFPFTSIDPVTKSQRPSWLFLPSVFTTPLLTTLQVSSLPSPHQEGSHLSWSPSGPQLHHRIFPLEAYLLWHQKLKLSSRSWKTEPAPNYTWPFRIWPLLPQLPDINKHNK